MKRLLILLLILGLVACGGDDNEGESEATEPGLQHSQPVASGGTTDRTTSQPTDEPPVPPVSLPLIQQTTIAFNTIGTLTVSYPEGWIFDGNLFIKSEAAANVAAGMLPGQVLLQFTANQPETPITLTRYVGLTFGESSEIQGINYTHLSDVTIGNFPAAKRMQATREGRFDQLVVVVQTERGSFVSMVAFVAPGLLPQYESLLLEIARSMQFTPISA